MREAYAIARDHLNSAAQRRKKEYDIKVKSMKFHEGDWVWYLYPRKYVNKSPKWNRNYQGPFLVIKVIAPCDYVIQLTKKSTPITATSWRHSMAIRPSPGYNRHQKVSKVSQVQRRMKNRKKEESAMTATRNNTARIDQSANRMKMKKMTSATESRRAMNRPYGSTKSTSAEKKLKKLEAGLPDKEKVKRKLKKFSWLSAFIVKQLRLWPNL